MTNVTMLDSNTKQRIVQAAVLAPSADNSQPWCYNWQGDTLNIYRDSRYSGHATDSSFVLTDLAIGCAIENAKLAAAQLGYKVCCQLFPEGEASLLSACLMFSLAEQVIDASMIQLAEQIENRCTDRRLPFSGVLSEQTVLALTQSINSEAVNLHCFTERAKISALAKIIKLAEAIRFKSELLHQELFSTVNFVDDKPTQGMTPAMLGIEAPARPFFRLISKWSTMQKFNLIGAAAMVAMRSVSLPLRLSPALAVITTSGKGRPAIIDAGQQMQRFWLSATQQGLAVHPYAAPGVLTLASPQLDSLLNQQLDIVQQQLQASFGVTQQVVMFFRLGYKTGAPVRSLRRNISELEYKMTP